MKVTALIPDGLIEEVKDLSQGKTITDSVIIALQEWVATKRIVALNERIKKTPLVFEAGFSAENVRKVNRKR